jgi:hypothetical protein
VNARVGPDGALYLADMYHGIIEHVIFIVPWLTKQIEQRKLYEGNDHGRIWRIVHEHGARRKGQRMSQSEHGRAGEDAGACEWLAAKHGAAFAGGARGGGAADPNRDS